MATKYYSDGTYTKGDGKLYYPGIGVVGRDKSTNVSKAESGSSTPINNTKTKTKTNSNSNSSSSSNRYNTTVTKKDGSTASGYIEDGKSYYSDGTRIGAGDSVVDAQGKVWTMGGNSDPDAGLSINDYLAKYGVNAPTGGGSSSSGSYKVTSADKSDRTAYLRSTKELADLYDINYDMDALRSIYDNATDAKYELLSKELEQSENDFYTNQANANATLLDTLRKATSSAIATGASRGIAGAEQLGLMMEAQQGAVDASTDLAQKRANMADEIAAEKADNIIKALEYSNQLKQNLINASTNIYSPDTQYDVGLLDFFAQMKNVEALFDQTAAQERINLASILSGDRNAQAQREHEANQGALDREAQKAINDATIKGNKEAAAITAAGYKAGSGSGYDNDYISQVLQAQKYMEDARKAGDISSYETWRMVLNALTNKPDEGRVDIFGIVNKDPYFKNSNAWEDAQKNPTNTVFSAQNIISKPTNVTQTASNIMVLKSLYTQYGANSKEFKEAYNKADSRTRSTFDNNYR